MWSQDSSVSIATFYRLDGLDLIPGIARFFSTASRLNLGLTQTPIQQVLASLFHGVKQQGHEADHSPPSSAEVKNGGVIPPPNAS
jgi:hypothetical protein